ncbi:MAG: hypothetical protein B7Z68_08335 [Acidobacteria bacterium 21-70-11]|nr:MAG: hypothetical protein B7Z68_08335 [Acidobacteria bacterium 21-70-11]OYW05503.1 MAG: hypothetical protein B7Z61_05945 [Acidobacteria bacterium 37-71-11]HQT94049.1 hypothetical protein [Thermoanaerobaculaceae bacterium]
MKRIAAGLVFVAALAVPALLLAHEGHTHHVVGTVNAISATNIDVKDSTGKVVSCQLTTDTKFRREETNVTAADVMVGERVVVEAAETDGKMVAKLVLLGKMSM